MWRNHIKGRFIRLLIKITVNLGQLSYNSFPCVLLPRSVLLFLFSLIRVPQQRARESPVCHGINWFDTSDRSSRFAGIWEQCSSCLDYSDRSRHSHLLFSDCDTEFPPCGNNKSCGIILPSISSQDSAVPHCALSLKCLKMPYWWGRPITHTHT